MTLSGNMLPTVKLSQFFDRRAVESMLSRKDLRFLRRAGGTVRITAKRSIRKRKSISKPGSPPVSHAGDLRNGIFYGLDSARGSVVIGPSPLRRRKYGEGLIRGATLLEFGGMTSRRGKQYLYRARPFMRPALRTTEPRLPQMFADA